jgi:hypothetical protein
MPVPTVRLKTRVMLPNGSRDYVDPIFSSLKPIYGFVDEKPPAPSRRCTPAIRQGGKWAWESLGSDPGGPDRSTSGRNRAGSGFVPNLSRVPGFRGTTRPILSLFRSRQRQVARAKRRSGKPLEDTHPPHRPARGNKCCSVGVDMRCAPSAAAESRSIRTNRLGFRCPYSRICNPGYPKTVPEGNQSVYRRHHRGEDELPRPLVAGYKYARRQR